MKMRVDTLAGAATPERLGSRSAWGNLSRLQRFGVRGWLASVGLLTLAFIDPLLELVAHSLKHDLHSHIVLVPLISAYLLYTQRESETTVHPGSIGGVVILGGVGLGAVSAAVAWRGILSTNDTLALMTLAYVSLLTASGVVFMGNRWMRAAAFPLAFLIFMVPLPDRLVYWLETASLFGSAEASALFFRMSGTPFLREDTVFVLPGIALEVARECSGIRSSWVLFITSVLASTLFLNSRWHRILLVAFVLPLGIVRNGFRILTIGLLCVHIGPHMIDSVIHRRGGPLFFAMSLVPLFLLLWWLRRRERKAQPAGRRW